MNKIRNTIAVGAPLFPVVNDVYNNDAYNNYRFAISFSGVNFLASNQEVIQYADGCVRYHLVKNLRPSCTAMFLTM